MGGTQMKKRFQMTMKQREAVIGLLLVMPFVVGFIMFYLYPLIQSVIFSLSELEMTSAGFKLHYTGLDNYHFALFEHPRFLRVLVENSLTTLLEIVVVILYSLFIATVLNQKFKGRILARLIFFLPLILGAGIILEIEQQDFLQQLIMGEAGAHEMGTAMTAAAIEDFLMELRVPREFLLYILNAVDRIPEIIRLSVVPILIFLAALQSIPSSLYEVANIEGANEWEAFWKITFPLISPLFLTNVVYILVTSFTAVGNQVSSLIQRTAWGGIGGYGVSTAMGWFYFLFIIIILALTVKITSQGVFYME